MSLKQLIFCLCLCIANFVGTTDWKPSDRLQHDAFPKSYSLKIVPDLNDNTFTGEVTIFIMVDRSLKRITLNSDGLTIQNVLLDQAYNSTGYQIDGERQFLHVFYEEGYHINPGEHILHIKFNGSMLGREGLFITKGENDFKTVVAKFPPMYARKAFPCFDEPSYRSIFSIRVIRPDSSYTVLSNMQQIEQFSTNGRIVDFQSSVPMPTYLVSFILTKYNYTQSQFTYKDVNIPLKLYSNQQVEEGRDHILKLVEHVLEFLTDYTDINFPLNKLDLIEIPHYTRGSVDHWGLITFDEGSLLFDKKNSPEAKIEHDMTAAIVAAHKTSHVWFGNLVTHEWYNDLWVTEGIASYMQFKALIEWGDKIEQFPPGALMDLHNHYTVKVRSTIFYVQNVNEVDSQYDYAIYGKGSAIMRMLELLMGEFPFRDGIRTYLKRHAYSSATTGDFINAMQSTITNKNIRSFMESWLLQSGCPLVTVSENNSSYIVKQSSFLPIFADTPGKSWTIPISYSILSANNTMSQGLVIFDRDMGSLSIRKPNGCKWLKMNYKQTGLFFTIYADEIYQQLFEGFSTLHSRERAHLIFEAINLYENGMLPCGVSLKFISKLKNDFTYIPLKILNKILPSTYLNFYNDEVTNGLLAKLIRITFGNHYSKYGWLPKSNESYTDRLIRLEVLNIVCFQGKQEECVEDARKLRDQNVTLHQEVALIQTKLLDTLRRGDENKTITASNDTIEPTETKTGQQNKRNQSDNEWQALPPKHKTECRRWIREELPKYMEESNKV